MDARIVWIHADRRGVADEMNVVAAGGELHAEFGGDYAGAAVGWVRGDADAHKIGFRVSPESMRAATIQQFQWQPPSNTRQGNRGLRTAPFRRAWNPPA